MDTKEKIMNIIAARVARAAADAAVAEARIAAAIANDAADAAVAAAIDAVAAMYEEKQ